MTVFSSAALAAKAVLPMRIPRLVIAGLAGGTGKTTISLGLCRAFARQGLCVQPFKKGPDYIDTAWLGLAAGREARNLDPFMVDEATLRSLFRQRAAGAALAITEGNRGYFDGMDLAGSSSTAELARRLEAPVMLVVDCTKMTRTVAALVRGCRNFPGGERIVGVILNRTRAARHSDLVKRAVEELADTPVLGVLPRLPVPPIVERRNGLVTVEEHSAAQQALDNLAQVTADHMDLPGILALAEAATPFPLDDTAATEAVQVTEKNTVTIGYVHDAALWQYYGENLDALREAGAELVPLSLLNADPWPALDGLYLGGGNCGGQAEALSAQEGRRMEVAALARSGLPIYAEQAGFIYLMEHWEEGGKSYPLAGVFPGAGVLCTKPQALGYVEATVMGANPYHPQAQCLKGHEYHYMRHDSPIASDFALRRSRGADTGREWDGMVYKNVFGSFMQIYAPAVPHWADAFVRAARVRKSKA